MITRIEAKKYYEYYSALIDKLMEAKIALLDGGVKSYTIDNRSLTRFDIDKLSAEIEDAIRQKSKYEAIMSGRKPRKAVAAVIRDY